MYYPPRMRPLPAVSLGKTRLAAIVLLQLLLQLLLLFVSAQPQAAGKLISGMDIQTGQDKTTVNIKFKTPLQYVRHFPTKSGRLCEITLSPVKEKFDEAIESESLTAKEGENRLLRNVVLDSGTLDSVTLTLHFNETTAFTVRQTSDWKSVTVTLVDPFTQRVKSGEDTDRPTWGAIVNTYVLNLQSSLKELEASPQLPKEIAEQFKLYTMRVRIKGKVWYRRRMGFFRTRSEAEKVRQKLLKIYPLAWIDLIHSSERPLAEKWFSEHKPVPKAASKPKTVLPPPTIAASKEQEAAAIPPPAVADSEAETKDVPVATETVAKSTTAAAIGTPISTLREPVSEKTEMLMESARQAMIDGDYRKAVKIYTKVLEGPDTAAHPEAQEFLGLARERAGQIAHAKAEYEEYLRRYPEGDGATRVKQRLDGIVTARQTSQPTVAAEAEPPPEEKPKWDLFGSLSQFYRYEEISNDVVTDQEIDNALDTDIQFQARRISTKYDMRVLFTGDNRYEFLEASREKTSNRVNTAYFDMHARKTEFGFRAGRQTLNKYGVLGRFDGAVGDYRFSPFWRANFVAGSPVEQTGGSFNETDKQFLGVSADLAAIPNMLDINVFAIEQRASGILDRRALGTELRYFDNQGRNGLLSIDYDISYSELNTALFVGTWLFPNASIINLTVDYRNSPILSTSNALLGQPVSSLDELENIYTDDEIRQLARDRTPRFTNVSFSGSYPLNDKIQLNGDIQISDLDGTPESGGVPELPDTGLEYIYFAQVTWSNLLTLEDVTNFGLRYSDLNNTDTLQFDFSSRFPLGRKWRLQPRVRLNSSRSTNGSTSKTALPSVRADYFWLPNFKVELEGGYRNMDREFDLGTVQETGWFIRAGYIWDFL